MIGLINGVCFKWLLPIEATPGVTTRMPPLLLPQIGFLFLPFGMLISPFLWSLHSQEQGATPLVLDTRAKKVTSQKIFGFEKWRLDHPEFNTLVSEVWNTPTPCSSAIDVWQAKTKLLRKKVKGWSINLEAALKTKKRDLIIESGVWHLRCIFRGKLSTWLWQG